MTPQGPNGPYVHYGQPQPPFGQYPVQVSGSTIMTLGIVSLFVLGFITGPIAWVMGNSALKAIDSGRANPADRDSASIGRTCGIIGTGLHSLGLIAYIAYTVFIYSTMWHAMNTIQSSMPVQQPPTVSSPTN